VNDQPRAFSTTLCRLSTAVLGTLLIILALDSVAQQPRQQLGVEIRQHSTFVSCAQPGEVTCMRPAGAVHPEGWTGLNVKNETDAWIELTIKRADSPFPRFKLLVPPKCASARDCNQRLPLQGPGKDTRDGYAESVLAPVYHNVYEFNAVIPAGVYTISANSDKFEPTSATLTGDSTKAYSVSLKVRSPGADGPAQAF